LPSRLVAGRAGALTDQERRPPAGVEHVGRRAQVRVLRDEPARPPGRRGGHDAVGVLGLRRRLLLHVVRQDDDGGGAGRESRAEGPVEHQRQLLGRGRDLRELRRDVLDQRQQVDLLLVLAAQHALLLLAHQRDHRDAVELRVVEAGEQVHRAGTLGGEADADAAGVLRVRDGHERRRLLVPCLHELRPAGPAQRAQNRVDAVAGVAEDPRHPPRGQPLHDQVRHEPCSHDGPLPRGRAGNPLRRRGRAPRSG
jgi:hypothetical protein